MPAVPFEVRAARPSLFSILVEALVGSLMPGQRSRFVHVTSHDHLRDADVLLTNTVTARSLVVFGAAPDSALVARHLDSGTHSMISVDASREELVAAIESLVDGPAFISAGVVATLAKTPASPVEAPLSAREREIVRFVVEGLSNSEIAAKLCLSPNTVRTHLQSASGKLGVSGRTRVAARARTLGIA
jgi:DNA-binding NarL/FixJ family response regulator